MSCCSSCAQGHGCESGLMSGLMGALVASGSEVKLGFEYGLQTTSEEAFQGYGEPGYIQEVLRGAILGSGLFQYVTVTVQPVSYAGLGHGYILVQGTLWQDVPYIGEIQNTVKGLILDYLPTVTITRDDPIWVLSTPQNRPDATQPFDPTKTANNNKPSGPCNWETQSIGDYLSCQLGLDTKTSVGIGAIGALAAVLLAVVLIKR